MYAKIRAVYSAVDACCEKLQKYKAEGVLDGYNEKLLDCLINPEPKPNSHNDALYIPIELHKPANVIYVAT